MNKLILMFLLGVFPLVTMAGEIKESKVPEAVRNYVKTNFPSASSIEWDYEKEEGFFEAEFKISGKKHELDISPEGKLIYSKIDIDESTIPSLINEYLKKNYEKYEILGAKKIVRIGVSGAKTSFDIGIRNGKKGYKNLYFDEEGKFLR